MPLRRATEEEIAQASYLQAESEQPDSDALPFEMDSSLSAISLGERFTVKNFTANKEAMRGALEKWGYEVQDLPASYGANLNFAARKRGSGGPWHPVDPAGGQGGFMEVIYDLSDLIVDAIQGVAIGAGTSAGGPLGGGAAGVASETSRQGIGHALGIPDNTDVFNIALAGVSSAAMPAIAKGAGGALKWTGKQALEIGAKFSGIKGIPGAMSAGEVAAMRAKDVVRLSRPVMSMEEAGRRIWRSLKAVSDEQLPAYKEARALVDQSTEPVNLSPILDGMRSVRDTVAKGLKNRKFDLSKIPLKERVNLARGGKPYVDIIDDTLNRVRLIVGDTPENRLPATIALEVKQFLQGRARDVGSFGEANLEKTSALEVSRFLSRASHDSRLALEDSMTKGGYPQFVTLMGKVARTMRRLDRLKMVFGITKEEEEGVTRAMSAAGRLYGMHSPLRKTLESSEELLGMPQGTLTRSVLRAHMGKAVGNEGAAPWLKFSGPYISGLGVAAGGMGLGLSGGIGGGLLFGLRSPRTFLGGVKATQAISAATGKIPSVLTGSARTGLQVAPIAVSRSVITSEQVAPIAVSRSVITSEDERRRKRGPLVLE